MKHLTTLLFSLTLSSAIGQDCQHVTFPVQMPDWGQGWNSANLDPSGGVLFTEWTLAMSYGRIGPDGQPDWDRRIVHMSPNIWLSPGKVTPRNDGGHLLSGYFSPSWAYDAPCMVSVAPNGQNEWARIYMADSSYEGLGAYPSGLFLLSDGDLLMPTGTYYGTALGLARLDATGVPIWLNRYNVGLSQTANQLYSAGSVLEPGDAVTMVGGRWNEGKLSIMRIDPDGAGEWAYTYDLPGVNPGWVIRAADGSYFVTGTYEGFEGCLVHFNSNGSFDWAKSYPMRIGSIAQLPGGDLLVDTYGYDIEPGLIRFAPDGTPVTAWNSIVPADGGCGLVGLRGDSVYVMHHPNPDLPASWTGLTIATSVDDLSCAFATTTLPSSELLSAPLSVSDTLIVTPDELKTWTMNVGEGAGADELDVVAFGTSGPARPGFDHMVYINPANMGGATSGPLTCTVTFDPLLSLVSAWPTPTSIAGNTVTWTDLDSLAGFDSQFMYLILTVPADASLIGTTLSHSCTISQDSTETDLANNTATFSTVITGSYDPNDKLVFPRDFYHIENDSTLDYTIQFQNTGNDTAFTVVVRDTLPLDVDTRTFEMGTASHPYTYSLTGNGILTFTFNSILLPDSNTNEPLSHGLVNFRIKPILPLQLGQEITNAADIYFDFNPPIHTPDATVVVTDETGVRPVVKPTQLEVYPVPVKNTLTAVVPEGYKPVHAFAISADGRRLPMVLPPSSAGLVQFATQHLPAGAYVLTLRAQDGKRLSARFVKE